MEMNRDQQAQFEKWIAERCAASPIAWCYAADLFLDYLAFCGIKAPAGKAGKAKFNKILKERGYRVIRDNGVRVEGLCLRGTELRKAHKWPIKDKGAADTEPI